MSAFNSATDEFQEAVVHGDELLTQYRRLTGRSGSNVADVVPAIASLLQFVRTEDNALPDALARAAALTVARQRRQHKPQSISFDA